MSFKKRCSTVQHTIVARYAVVSGVGGVQAAFEQTLMMAPRFLSSIWGSSKWVIWEETHSSISGKEPIRLASLVPRLSSSFSLLFALQATKSWMTVWEQGYKWLHSDLYKSPIVN